MPFAVLLAMVVVYPVARAAWWAFSNPTGTFGRMATDRVLWWAAANTLAFTLAYAGLLLVIGLALASLLNARGLRHRAAVRTLLFSGHLVGGVYVAAIVTAVVARDTGLLAPLLPSGFDVLGTPWLAMPVVLLASLWTSAGFATVYLLAALQAVDPDLLDAARVDGASSWQRFGAVTWPAVRPTAWFVVLTAAVGGLQLFELPFVLFNATPGPGNAALTLSMVLFSAQFEQADPAYASAIGWAMALLVTGFMLALVRRSMEVDRAN
jgi:ABC-type sugar transport system permease subunit